MEGLGCDTILFIASSPKAFGNSNTKVGDIGLRLFEESVSSVEGGVEPLVGCDVELVVVALGFVKDHLNLSVEEVFHKTPVSGLQLPRFLVLLLAAESHLIKELKTVGINKSCADHHTSFLKPVNQDQLSP